MSTASGTPKPTYKKHPAEDFLAATREERASRLASMPRMVYMPIIPEREATDATQSDLGAILAVLDRLTDSELSKIIEKAGDIIQQRAEQLPASGKVQERT